LNHAVSIEAPAKVNLRLRVLGRRPDGFHELDTVFQAIDFSDRLVVQLGGEGVQIEVAGPDLGAVEENLAYRAAVAFMDATALDVGVHVSLTKRIPAGAGLGGGSSDAGAVLTALQHLTGDPLEGADVLRIASGLGADVPFFVCGSALAVGSGKGDLLERLEPLREVDMLVVLPPVHVATRAAFAGLSRSDVSLRSSEHHAESARCESWEIVAASATNDFEAGVGEAHPEVSRALAALRSRGYPLTMLSGSGSACFAVVGEGADPASDAAELSAELGWPCIVTRTLRAPPRPRPA
jgi:4-diphosphocytidyl-2-C-methyl-D-erythritol kinase